MTSLAGFPLEHTSTAPTANRFGVVATSATFAVAAGRTHASLCEQLRQSPHVAALQLCPPSDGGLHQCAQALDVARAIDGQPLTLDVLSAFVGAEVTAFSCPESETVRYKQSVATRLHLQITGPARIQSAFYKRCVLGELPHALAKHADKGQQYKLARDVKSAMVRGTPNGRVL